MVYALVTFDEYSEDGDGNDQRTWYTTQIKQVNVTRNGDVGDFTFSLNKTEAARGEFLTVTYTEAENADHYWIDIEQWDDDGEE